MLNPVHSSVTSRMIVPDARSAGMSDVRATTDPDVVSQYWSPAKYPFTVNCAEMTLNYIPWPRQLVNDIDLAYLIGYYRIGDYSAVSGSLRYFSLDEMTTSVGGDDKGGGITINPYEMSLDAAHSLALSERFSLGVTVHWIYSDLTHDFKDETAPGSTFAADIPAYYQNYINLGEHESQLGTGLNVSNIGNKTTFDDSDNSEFTSINLQSGISLMIPIDEYNRLTLAADTNKLLVPTYPRQNGGESTEDYQERVQKEYYDMLSINNTLKSFSDAPNGTKEELQEIQWSVGAKYVYRDQFVLQAGHHHQAENKGNLKYFTVGAGFKISVFSLGVGYVIAMTKSNPFDQALRFSLNSDMNEIRDLFRR